MFYRVLFPTTPRDPHRIHHASLDALVTWAGGVPGPMLKLTEETAVRTVREHYPDAVGMPMTVRVGSGTMTVLGILESIRSPHPVTPEEAETFEIPFVAFVLAIPETTADKKPGRQFHSAMWRVPPRGPTFALATHRDVELRSTELDNPIVMDVVEGADANGRRVIYGRMPAHEIALIFQAPTGVSDLRFQVFQEGDGFYARSDAFPASVVHGESDVLALCGALDDAKRSLPRAAGLVPDAEIAPRTAVQELWAVDKRIAGEAGISGDGYHVEDGDGQRVMLWRDMLTTPERRDARDYVPWHGPPDWPGVAAVLHPATWSSCGPLVVEGLLRRFGKEVHVFRHGHGWHLVFVDEPANGEALYSQHDCRLWMVAHTDGRCDTVQAS
jgi:hypothetical protein